MSEYIVYHKNESDWILRLANGRFKKVPAPKFFHGQVVTTTPKHFSQSRMIILIEPSWTKTQGWVYGNEYCGVRVGKIKAGGGYSFSWEEEDFCPIDDYETRLMEQIFYKERELAKLASRKKQIEGELTKLQFTQKTLAREEPKFEETT